MPGSRGRQRRRPSGEPVHHRRHLGGYRPAGRGLGTHTGHAAIAHRYSTDVHPLSFSAHFLANESITVDGDTATGSWRFLQTATLGGQAPWIAGHYHADFTCTGGPWKIKHLRIGNLFTTPYEDGWAKTPFTA